MDTNNSLSILSLDKKNLDTLVYAGFWRRFAAFLLDFLVLLPLAIIDYFFSDYTRLFLVYWLIPGILFGLWFHVYLVSRYGGTPGKLILKMKISMLDGTPVTLKASLLRYSVTFVLAVLTSVALAMAVYNMTDEEYFSLEYIERSISVVQFAPSWYENVNLILIIWVYSEFITMLFNKKKRSFQDFMAGTVVVRSEQKVSQY